MVVVAIDAWHRHRLRTRGGRMLAMLEHRNRSRLLHVGTGIAIALFAVWTTTRAYEELFRSRRDDPFITVEVGRAIHMAAPNPNDLAMGGMRPALGILQGCGRLLLDRLDFGR